MVLLNSIAARHASWVTLWVICQVILLGAGVRSLSSSSSSWIMVGIEGSFNAAFAPVGHATTSRESSVFGMGSSGWVSALTTLGLQGPLSPGSLFQGNF